MVNRLSLAYRLATRLAHAALPMGASLSPKLRLATAGRLASAARFAEWGRGSRDRARPLIVFHAASAGELRQAEPVLRRLRARHPEWQFALTYFSPSAAPVAEALPADVAGYAPWDIEAEVAPFLDALSPSALIWSKLDLWPALALAAASRGVRLGLIAGTVRARSGRLQWPACPALRPAYASLDAGAAISEEDAARLVCLGVRAERLTVAGDPRFDAVLERIEGQTRRTTEPDTLVAGSTWPADEEVLLRAFGQVRDQHPTARLIIAPHEPTPSALDRLATRAKWFDLPHPVPLGQATTNDALVVVDQVGALALEYARGSIAYVGGGFRQGGVHSVLEPAAWGMPVLVGPEARDDRHARQLNQAEALEWLPRRRAAAVLEAWWLNWINDGEWRARAGAAARKVVEDGLGSADRCVTLVESLVRAGLEPTPASTSRNST